MEMLYNKKKRNMPIDATPAQIMSEVHSDFCRDILNHINAPTIAVDAEDHDQLGVDSSPPVVVTSQPSVFFHILRRCYMSGVLWSSIDFGGIMNTSIVIVSSFAVCTFLGPHVVAKNANKNGWVAGPAFAMRKEMALVQILQSQGHNVVCLDLIPGGHEADFLDNGVPKELRSEVANYASELIVCVQGNRVIGLGKHVHDALNAAAKKIHGSDKAISTFNITKLPHPTVMSPYVWSNVGALNYAGYYDSLYHNQCVSFFGLVLLYGLNSDKYEVFAKNDDIGGIIGAIITMRVIEKITGKPVNDPHSAVLAYSKSLSIFSDNEATTLLRSTNRGNLKAPLSRTAMFLSDKGSYGGVNDKRVLVAKASYEELLSAEEQDMDAIAAANDAYEEAKKKCYETSAGKGKGGLKSGSYGGENNERVIIAKA
jgi:hypothetical protein